MQQIKYKNDIIFTAMYLLVTLAICLIGHLDTLVFTTILTLIMYMCLELSSSDDLNITALLRFSYLIVSCWIVGSYFEFITSEFKGHIAIIIMTIFLLIVILICESLYLFSKHLIRTKVLSEELTTSSDKVKLKAICILFIIAITVMISYLSLLRWSYIESIDIRIELIIIFSILFQLLTAIIYKGYTETQNYSDSNDKLKLLFEPLLYMVVVESGLFSVITSAVIVYDMFFI